MRRFILCCISFLAYSITFAQNPPLQTITTPMESQAAMVMQRVGMTDITINYSRPAVKGRKVWGDLVPYNDGKPIPWRAGANENTTITFSNAVKINGQDLPAGKYGLHMIPSATDWTIIFSKYSSAWGSFSYKKEEDALRVQTIPVKTTMMQEYLQYQFDALTDTSAKIELWWEYQQIPFSVSVNTKQVMLDYMHNAIRSPIAFSWQGWNSMADYSLKNNYNLEEALTWAQRSVATNENYINLRVKSDIEQKLGKNDDAAQSWKRALEVGSFSDLSGGLNLFVNQKNWEKAKEVAAAQESRFPSRWQSFYNSGIVYKGLKDNVKAKEYFTKALGMATDANAKTRIENQMKDLQ